MTWESVALTYFACLLAAAALGPGPAPGRWRAAAVCASAMVMLLALMWAGGFEAPGVPPAAAAVLPAAVLLAGYRASGLFFAAPMQALETRLLAWDRRWLVDTGLLGAYHAAPGPVRAAVELSYLLTYAVAPAGALVLAFGSHEAINRYWVGVLGAGLGSYAVLPWVQTRPPRALEDRAADAPPDAATRAQGGRGVAAFVRGLNLGVLERASIGANTIPSGHAAVAVASALGVVDAAPLIGAMFLLLACGIVVATVVGRYHYLVDTVLGVVVAVAARTIASRWA